MTHSLRLSAPGVDLFVCGIKTPPCSSPHCRADSVTKCAHPLGGKYAGRYCNRPLCERCAVKVGDKHVCGAHARAAGVKAKSSRRRA